MYGAGCTPASSLGAHRGGGVGVGGSQPPALLFAGESSSSSVDPQLIRKQTASWPSGTRPSLWEGWGGGVGWGGAGVVGRGHTTCLAVITGADGNKVPRGGLSLIGPRLPATL